MTAARTAPNTIDGYINRFPSDVRVILQRIRRTIRAVAPKGGREHQLQDTDV
jgi:hypothetical protein